MPGAPAGDDAGGAGPGPAEPPGAAGAAGPEVGLCRACDHARPQRSPRGSAFWRCGRAEREPGFLRYPPLPVVRCAGFEPGAPREG